jgi:hypothetical protein
MKAFVICLMVISPQLLTAQITGEQIIGEWITRNADSSYYKNLKLELHQDGNYESKKLGCWYTTWEVANNSRLNISDVYLCTEPPRGYSSPQNETWEIVNKEKTQFIKIRRGEVQVELLRIVSYKEKKIRKYPYHIKIMQLERTKF